MITALEALARLREGNQRFIANQSEAGALGSHGHRAALAAGPEPLAIVLGCSDARVPAELVFDQGFGDLFVIRVAGNVVSPSQIGSVEFAAGRYGTRLVVVMGHSQCGAVLATFDALTGQAASQSQNLLSIVDRVRPSMETVMATAGPDATPETLIADTVRANVRSSANHLRHGSGLLERLIGEGTLMVVGAEYSLETGVVTFFDGVPGGADGALPTIL
jgi:carbonic anhydrase